MSDRVFHSRPVLRLPYVGGVLLVAAVVVGCSAIGGRPRQPLYVPQGREITVTTIPLLVRESEGKNAFLQSDFAKGGVLEGKEVYAFSPSTITVVEGDMPRPRESGGRPAHVRAA
jgi:hypothetical protein